MPALLLLALLSVQALEELPSRTVLLHGNRRSPGLLVVLGATDPGAREKMRAAAKGLGARRQGTLTLLEASEAKEEDFDSESVILVGTPRANPWIARIAGRLPVEVDEKGIRLQGKLYDGPRDSLQLVYPSPFRASRAGGLLTLVTGNSDEAVLEGLEHRRRGDFQIRRDGTTLVLGRFRGDWSLDPEELVDLGSAAEPSREDISRKADEVRHRIAELLGPLPPAPDVSVRLYPSLEIKGLATDDTRPAHFEGALLHAVPGTGTEPERLLADRFLEARIPDATIRRGLSTWLVSTENELDAFDHTTYRLAHLRERPRLETLSEESPFALEAMSTSFVRFVLRERGADALRGNLDEVLDLESRWIDSLEAGEPRPAPELDRFQHGFTFSQEGFEIHDGYLSARSVRSLEKLRSLGVDSVAIVPYAFMNEPSSTSPLAIPARAGSETDEAVTHAIEAAQARGMTVLLKPQIWLRRSWPGEIEPQGPDEEERFFREYGRWIRHYALLSEKQNVEILAIGTELSRMTSDRASRWEALIRDVRVLYHGRLVYAANWGDEVERVSFWPLLDYIGVDFYYPLSQEDSPSGEALRAGFEKSLESIRALSLRHQKPVLLTEIGYGSTRSPWKSPHSSDGDGEPSPADQARAYEAAFAVLTHETSWIRGMYWWKWPTDPVLGGAGDPGFTPSGKPAEEVIRREYKLLVP